jgi:hypothetical protein
VERLRVLARRLSYAAIVEGATDQSGEALFGTCGKSTRVGRPGGPTSADVTALQLLSPGCTR